MRTSLLLLAVVGTALAEVFLDERFDKGKNEGFQITNIYLIFTVYLLNMWQASV